MRWAISHFKHVRNSPSVKRVCERRRNQIGDFKMIGGTSIILVSCFGERSLSTLQITRIASASMSSGLVLNVSWIMSNAASKLSFGCPLVKSYMLVISMIEIRYKNASTHPASDSLYTVSISYRLTLLAAKPQRAIALAKFTVRSSLINKTYLIWTR